MVGPFKKPGSRTLQSINDETAIQKIVASLTACFSNEKATVTRCAVKWSITVIFIRRVVSADRVI